MLPPRNRHERKATWPESNPQGRWRPFGYDRLAQRDKLSLDIFWLKGDSLEDSANLENPDVIAAEMVEELRAALEEFELILGDLSSRANAIFTAGAFAGSAASPRRTR